MRRALLSFVAGFLSVLAFHQPVLWLLHQLHMTDRMPYPMKGVPPFGVPAVISLAFWGGVWGIITILAIAKARGAGWWLAAIVFGALAPTLVAGLVIMPLRGQAPAAHRGTLLLFGLAVNGAWGLGTAVFYR